MGKQKKRNKKHRDTTTTAAKVLSGGACWGFKRPGGKEGSVVRGENEKCSGPVERDFALTLNELPVFAKKLERVIGTSRRNIVSPFHRHPVHLQVASPFRPPGAPCSDVAV